MFDNEVLRQVAAVAKTYNLDLAALLAVVEIESGGRALEADGKTPCFLFEKHIFYRQLCLLDRSKLAEAVSQGLAFETWQPGVEYKNEATSAERLALLARARAIHEEAADRSASWGVGQTMGFLCRDLGFVDARHMLDFMVQGGIAAQVECMVREIEHSRLHAKLNAHDWAGFAKGYNGAGYKQNQYDTRLASAYARWEKKAAAIAALPLPPERVPTGVPPAAPRPRPTPAPGPVIIIKPTPPAKPLPRPAAHASAVMAVVAALIAAMNSHSVAMAAGFAFGGFIAAAGIYLADKRLRK